MEKEGKNDYGEMSLASLIGLDRKPVAQGHLLKVDLTHTEYDLVRHVAASLGWRVWSKLEDKKEEAILLWRDTYITEDFLKKLLPYQRVSRFPCSHELGRKSSLALNLNRMQKHFPAEYSFYPRTWRVPAELQEFRQYAASHPGGNFILKPEAGCQGKGISILPEPLAFCPDQPMVVQQYVSAPLLIDGLKFDFRLYVLLQSVAPLRIYLYREGLARFATHQYCEPTPANILDHRMHLTNYAINKKSPEFIFNSKASEDHVGHKRSLSAVLALLRAQGADTGRLMHKIQELVVKTFISTYPQLLAKYQSASGGRPDLSFEIFGFDVLVTNALEPLLLEVNHTPSFCTDTPLDYQIKRSLLFDTFRLLNFNDQARRGYLDQRTEKVKRCSSRWKEGPLGGFINIYPLKHQALTPLARFAVSLWQKATGRTRPNSEKEKQKKNKSNDCRRIQPRRAQPAKETLKAQSQAQQLHKTVTRLRPFERGQIERRSIFSVFLATRIGQGDPAKGKEEFEELVKLARLKKLSQLQQNLQQPLISRQEAQGKGGKALPVRHLRDIRYLRQAKVFRGESELGKNENPLQITGQIMPMARTGIKMKHLVKLCI